VIEEPYVEIEIPMGTIAILHQGEIITPLVHWVRRMPSELHLVTPRGTQIPRQRNIAGRNLIGEWLLFVDSDTVPPNHTIQRMLSHNVPIVSAVVLERFAPHKVAAIRTMDPQAVKWDLADLPGDGLLPTPGTGCAGLMIRREVLDKVETPWFRCGQLILDCLTEDTEFCFRAAQAGFPTMLDCGLRFGHKADCVLWPGRDGKMWIEWPGMDYEYKFPVEPRYMDGMPLQVSGL